MPMLIAGFRNRSIKTKLTLMFIIVGVIAPLMAWLVSMVWLLHDSRETLRQDLVALSFGTGAVIVLAGYWLFRRMSHSIVEPIASLADISRRIAQEGDFSRRAEAGDRDDEIGQLARNFNSMLDSLVDRDNALLDELQKRKRTQARLDRLAHFDQITGLPNRHYFDDRLELALDRAIRFAKPMALMFVDLDNFKYVNDNLGHSAGDQMLAIIANRITDVLRADDIVCRIGGDEFAVIIENLSEREQAGRIAGKLIDVMQTPVNLNGQDMILGASIGIVIAPDNASDRLTLARFADAAMYHAKDSGKNRWSLYADEIGDKSQRRLTLETQLRKGIADDQFVLHYQPQYDIERRQVTGVEALVRWHHPERGLVFPAEFIGVAEDTRLIIPLGAEVLAIACRQIGEWRQSGVHVPKVSVNVSIRQLELPNFADSVFSVLTETGCKADRLELEITESALISSNPRILETMGRLRLAGIGILIDDFGVGYSSMSYLKHFPVSGLKIDKSFVDDVTVDPNDLAITRAIITLGHSLGLDVIAEGVETAQQMEQLRTSGCSLIQGHLISRPLPADDLAAFYRQAPGKTAVIRQVA
jgi:diguanylate cyclase (GGDEF)-like protein